MTCCRATIDEVETDVVEIEAKLDKVRKGPGRDHPVHTQSPLCSLRAPSAHVLHPCPVNSLYSLLPCAPPYPCAPLQLAKLCSGMIEAGKAYVATNRLFVSGIRDLSQQCQGDTVILVRTATSTLRLGSLGLDAG